MQRPDKLTAICRAREVIHKYDIEEPRQIVIEDIAAALGAVTKEEPIVGADGRLVAKDDQGIITVRESIRDPNRKRFVIAHELGHFLLHRNTVPGIINDTEHSFQIISDKSPIESEANYFASEILMPEDMFKAMVFGKDLTMKLLLSLCEEFQTSLTATAIRFAIMRPDYALICSSANKIEWFVIDPDNFPYFVNTRGKVHPDSLAADYFTGESLLDRFFPVEHHAWLSVKWFRGTLKELTIPIPQIQRVLSFLYVEED